MSPEQAHAQALALAGLLQCTYLVDLLARSGQAEQEAVTPVINSLFQFDAKSPEAVYGGARGVNLGLGILKDLLEGKDTSRYRMTLRYAMSLLYLQKKLSARDDMLEVIRSRLQHAGVKQDHFSSNINDISTSIAAIYQDTISTFKYRVEINGSAQQLQNSANADKIRALLLAGIRSAVMWRQYGGKRWHLFLSRQRLREATEHLLTD